MDRIAHRLSQSGPGLMTIAISPPPLSAARDERTFLSVEQEGMDRWDDDGGADRWAGRLMAEIGPALEPRRSP